MWVEANLGHAVTVESGGFNLGRRIFHRVAAGPLYGLAGRPSARHSDFVCANIVSAELVDRDFAHFCFPG